MPELLSKGDIWDLIAIMRKTFRFIGTLRDETKVAKHIQYPKIPPLLSESLTVHLINDGQILREFSHPRLGGRNEADILCLDDTGKMVSVEVKGTGASAWVFLGPKDYSADYLVWIAFGDYFENAALETVDANVIQPSAIREKRQRITLQTLEQLVDEVETSMINLQESLQRSGLSTSKRSAPRTSSKGNDKDLAAVLIIRPKATSGEKIHMEESEMKRSYTPRTNSGAKLNDEWNVGAKDAKYHKDGKFFMPLNRFPGALFDPNGYVLFRTEEDYLNSQHLSIGEKINVPGGIYSIPEYRKVR